MYPNKTTNANKVRSEGIAMAQCISFHMYSCRTCLALVIAPGRVTLFMLGIGHVRSVHVRQSTASCMHIHRGHTSCMTRSMTSRDGRDVADQARYMLQGQEFEISADTD